jgi:hypothetical protein
MAAGGSEGERSKKKRVKKTWEEEEKEGVMVVGKRKLNKESVSGPVGFGPQAQRVKACSWCYGPILGSMCDPALQ